MLISHPASNSRLRSFAKQKESGRCGYERQDSNSMCETSRMRYQNAMYNTTKTVVIPERKGYTANGGTCSTLRGKIHLPYSEASVYMWTNRTMEDHM